MRMDVPNNPSQQPNLKAASSFTETHRGSCSSGDHLYSPNYSPSPMSYGPGFALLRGHIKLMAMVPHLPENQVSQKSWDHESFCSSIPSCYSPHPGVHSSQSFPPITPRMMPSISQKYWAPRQPFPMPPIPMRGAANPSNGYYNPSCYLHPSVWHGQRNRCTVPLQMSSPSSSSLHQRASMGQLFQDVFPGSGQASSLMEGHAENSPLPPVVSQSFMESQQYMAYQMMNQRSYANSQLLEYSSYPYHQYSRGTPQSGYYQSFPPQMSFSPNQISPYSPHMASSEGGVHSAPGFFNGTERNYSVTSPPSFNSCGMFPPLYPEYCSPSTLDTRSRTLRKRTPRKSKKSSGDTSEKEVCIVIEEEEISSSSSLSSTEKYEIRKKVPSVNNIPTGNRNVTRNQLKEETETTLLNEQGVVTAPLPSVISQDSVVEEDLHVSNNGIIFDTKQQTHQRLLHQQKSGVKRGNHPPEVVSVHNCFLSDSSEAEQDPEHAFPSDIEGSRKSGIKKKPGFMKNLKNSGGGIAEAFDDLDIDLSPDELRTFTSEYLVELLSSQDWNDCSLALQIIIRFARHRPQTLLNHFKENGAILWCTFAHITSPKSALCRAAVTTFKELFEKIPGALDNHLDKIAEKLVAKSLAPNKFIRVECEKALMSMVEHGNLIKILSALEHMRKKGHTRAPGMKVALARMTLLVVQTAGVDLCLMNTSYAEKLLPMLFCFMMEPNNQIRKFSKDALGMLMNHLQFESSVLKYVKFDRNATEVFKKLEKMRNRSNHTSGNTTFHHCHQKPVGEIPRIF